MKGCLYNYGNGHTIIYDIYCEGNYANFGSCFYYQYSYILEATDIYATNESG